MFAFNGESSVVHQLCIHCFFSRKNKIIISTNDVVDRREAANATKILKNLLSTKVYDIRTRPYAQSEFGPLIWI